MTSFRNIISRLLVLAALPAYSLRAAEGTYHIAACYTIGGSGSYDYVRFDPIGKRLFVSHQSRVEVLDAGTGGILGSIIGLQGVHGIALASDLGRGFITNGGDGTVTVFDLSSLAVLQSIKTGGTKPDAIEYDPASHTVVVSNGHSNDESLIDAATGAVRQRVPLLGNPESIALDGNGHALVNLESHNSVALVDIASGKVLADWPIGPGEGPTGLAIDREHGRAFVSCGGNRKMVVMDVTDGRKVAILTIGDDSDGAAFDRVTGNAFSSNREGTLTIIHGDDSEHYRVVQTVATQFGAKTLAVDSSSGRVFLPVAQLAPGRDEDHPGPAVPGSFKVLVVSP